MNIRKINTSEQELTAVANLYHAIWKTSPDEFVDRIKRHATYLNFRGIVAIHHQEIIGFAYGYSSVKGQYYHDLLRKALSQIGQTYWLDDCFEFVELAVHPSYRRKKLGKNLATKLVEAAPNKTAILTTQKNNSSARALYASLGWEVIQDNFLPSNNGDYYVIMGKNLFERKGD